MHDKTTVVFRKHLTKGFVLYALKAQATCALSAAGSGQPEAS